ncbi:MAG: hypothetical protein NC827_06020 [Candidatus Omnitrophica bacterium]|nr:hypothetical protein [Candidatus Omnitrophota bacterium]
MSKEFETILLKYLERNINNENWKWKFENKIFSAKELIEEIKKNKKLKETIINQIFKYASEELLK